MNEAAGIVIFAKDTGRVLVIKRAKGGEWGVPGGGIEQDETAEQAARRELQEECGLTVGGLRLVRTQRNPDGTLFTVFRADVPRETQPTLNNEHTEFKWANAWDLPRPSFATNTEVVAAALYSGPGYAQDKSERVEDVNGWFEIARNPISRAGVFPYRGKSISPDLEPDKIYYALRSPEELGSPETVASFRLVPWIAGHTMLGKDFETEAEEKGVGGVTGERVEYDATDDTLYSNIKLFSATQKDLIDDKGVVELSCGYRCDWVYRPGTYNGKAYDFVQTNIRGNHLASVPTGRMGRDIAVMDEGETKMDLENLSLEEIMALAAKVLKKLNDEGKLSEVLKSADISTGDNDDTEKAGDNDDTEKAGDNDDTEKKEPPKAGDNDDGDALAVAEEAKKLAEEAKEIATGMDSAADVIAALGRRDKMARLVMSKIGVFDHSEMTEKGVAQYAAKKLGLQCKPGTEAVAVNAYIQGMNKAAPTTRHVSHAQDAADAPSGESSFLDKFK